ncbi:MAG TPA: CoA protein activase [Nitrospiraceae bacterium]|nr:MAG: CoA protein activase [Nitrospirae bacterium GWA2_46_11]OGW24896.1 MAG: CoA protein activase [Nitrospirae bacterium GWB2_47_37]HAK88523.1 CoA protein activase [Nitrospiraceae bacterium]HCZ12309.1 CoA protein activase [Nitrospiraceae bacterium]
MHFIGLDAGSVAVKLVILDENGSVIERHYVRHYGHAVRAALELFKGIKEKFPETSLSVTGSAGKSIASTFKIRPINEIVAQSYSVKKMFPDIKTVIELGGEDSKLLILENGNIKDFSMNSVCAAGTGSFLEQQAERLRLGIEEFGEIAARSKRPSKIAGRCSVFAKSDMIHLQQIATPVEDIVSGLCFAVARNFKGTIAKGRDVKSPMAFQGGVAANKGMIRAFKEVFDLDDLFIPPDFAFMGALGSVLKDMDEGCINTFDINALESFVLSAKFSEQGHAPLITKGDDFFERHSKGSHQSEKNKNLSPSKINAYLGIDIGSISTNLAVIDEDCNLLAKRYLMTAGRPIEAVKQGLEEIYEEIGSRVEIAGVGTTGSGRYMIADYVGADIVKNEITAQATAAIYIDPAVDTIFEIGGQDSKYISIRDGIIVDFEMNKACAAGTGSFIEEQAEKLDISVKKEFAECAFRAASPCRLGERCTVFMENSLMANLQRGAEKDGLLAGLAYSIVQNYINRVVAGKPAGKNIFFQGGVAFNKAVVAAFEKYLDRKITVPPNHDVTGAIGMALIAMRHMKDRNALSVMSNEVKGASRFKGFEFSRKPYEISSFECKGCPNVCEINRVKIQDEEGYLFYGGRCEKYDVRRAKKSELPDLFAFREEMLWKEHNARTAKGNGQKTKGIIGIPYIFFFHDHLPFWSAFLWELGFEVIVSPKTNKQVVNLGVENVLSEACFPVKVAHGHIKWLKDAGADAIFIPSFIGLNRRGEEYNKGTACPHTQTIPYVSKAAIQGIKILSPVVNFELGVKSLKRELKRALKEYDVRGKDIERALQRAESAQAEFQSAIKEKGKDILGTGETKNRGNGESVIVIIGRAYNAFDSGVNLEIPKKLSYIDVLSIPMDMLPADNERLLDSWPNMYWKSGQKILGAARIVKNTPNLYAIYIGNFSCGPDSFILKYFKEEMQEKPFLHIEIDEHSADAGAVTRCEAFLDSIEQQRRGGDELRVKSYEFKDLKTQKHKTPNSELRKAAIGRTPNLKKKTVFIPRMADHAFALKSAFEYCGVPAEVLPESDKESVDAGRRYVSGKECYPYLVTAGDMLKKVFSADFKPEESAFFMPSGTGPCRFGQYNVAQKLILEKLGLKEVPIFAPNQDIEFYRDLGIAGKDFSMRAWRGIIAYEMLTKCLHETRPYEKTRGDSEGLYENYSERIGLSISGRNGDIKALLKDMGRSFMSISLRKEKRPLIGIVGEIFVRSHKFSNEQLVEKIESLGGEAWLAPIEEWIYYVNAMSQRKALIKKDRSAIMNIFLKRVFQKRIQHGLEKPFRGFLKTLKEPDTKEILKQASPYVHDSFEGETVLSVGKAIDLINRGASGIVNAMPFGCMPGTIVTALMKAVSKDYGVPCISIPYDGTESPATALQIEAFMEAAKIRR